MIEFNCPSCGKLFRVPPELAGRAAKCKACGTLMTVPAQSATVTVPPSPSPAPAAVASPVAAPKPAAPVNARIPMRTRRLLADAQHVVEAFKDSEIIRVVETDGNPPDRYRIEYLIRSLQPTDDPEEPAPRDVHQVEIQLTADYPRVAPQCKMLTPVYHPNIDPSHVCVGDHWAAGERLVDLIVRIGEMLAYQAYNIKSPLDGEAAMWADLHTRELPMDDRSMRPPELD